MTSSQNSIIAFCTDCGSIQPRIKDRGDVQCYVCSLKVAVDGESKLEYRVIFNPRQTYKKKRAIKLEDEDEGPIVEKRCPKCDNETMSYATLQLRSADEGQTVFFTCTKCKYKYNENS